MSICVKLCHLEAKELFFYLHKKKKSRESSRYDIQSKKKPDRLLLFISRRKYACELRLLAKQNKENRACIAEAGAIPLLVSLLSVSDLRTQEHAVTALFNLSIYEDNKRRIITSGAVPGMVHVLKRGSMEARENAATTLFSLFFIDENKVSCFFGSWVTVCIFHR